MEARITQFFDRYIKGSYFPEMHITDIIEIIIIAFLVYQLMIWIKNTKAWMLLKELWFLVYSFFWRLSFRCIRYYGWRKIHLLFLQLSS